MADTQDGGSAKARAGMRAFCLAASWDLSVLGGMLKTTKSSQPFSSSLP